MAIHDALLASFCTMKRVNHGIGQSLCIVWRHIKTVGATSLLETGACTGNNREPTADGFDNRNAETFVAGRIDERFCLSIETRQMVIGHVVEQE